MGHQGRGDDKEENLSAGLINRLHLAVIAVWCEIGMHRQ